MIDTSGLAVFGETNVNDTSSIYTYSNVMTLDLMSELAKNDERFDNINQADVLNLALMVLDGFITSKKESSKSKLCEFANDREEFKIFALNTINYCRFVNKGYNSTIDEFIQARSD